MIARYYEIQAAMVAGCEVDSIFHGPKKKEPVLARQLSIYFREEAYPLESYTTIAARYGRDHSTVNSSKRAINNLYDTNKEFRELKDKYMRVCYGLKKELENKESGVATIEKDGLNEFVRQQQAKFANFIVVSNSFLIGKATDEKVIDAIDEVEIAISKIRHNFSI